MRKTTYVVCVIVITVLAVFPNSALAIWWNPFTWKIFNTEKVTPIQVQEAPIVPYEASKEVEVEKIEQVATSSVSAKPPVPVAQTSVAKISPTVSESDQAEITSVIYGFIIAISKKDGATANSFVSNKTQIYFDKLLNLSRTSPKTELLKEDFSTITTVLLVRLGAASSTLDLKGSDIVPQAVVFGTSTWMSSPNFFDLGLTFEKRGPNTVFVTSKSLGQVSIGLTLIKENGLWKIDYIPNLEKQNADIERRLREYIQKTGMTREQTVEALLQLFFGRSSTELDYLMWIPLNERGELKVDNAKFASLSDPANGWSILYPNHWEIDYVDSTTFFLAPYSADGFRPSVAITPNQSPVSTELDRYARYVVDEIPKLKTDLTGNITSEKTAFHDQPAYRIVYDRLRTFDGGRTYIRQTTDSILVMNNGIAYLIEYRNGVADFEKTKPLADKVIDSFRFETVCTQNCIVGGRN